MCGTEVTTCCLLFGCRCAGCIMASDVAPYEQAMAPIFLLLLMLPMLLLVLLSRLFHRCV